MIRGLYTAASGMLIRQAQQENLSNNIANLNTPGYKKDNIISKSFEEMLIQSVNKNANGNAYTKPLGYMEFGVGIDETNTNFGGGIIEETGRNLDFAVGGEGFFTVSDLNGEERYTRDGRFGIDNEGYLINSNGYRVLVDIDGQGTKLPLIVNNSDFSINQDGTLNGSFKTVINGNQTDVNGLVRFSITKFDDKNDLQKDGFNCYKSINQTGQTDKVSKIRQNSLERSNVDALEAITDMISIMRSYESNQKVIQQMDETLGKTVNEVGSVR